jgi:ATP/maltotriose-dependent transcriptional regulator MalT
MQGDLVRAESILNAETSANTPTQTVGQRMVWCARAELALARGDAELALEITDQLIASAANVSAQHGIARLSKLRGEALAALHHEAEAETELRTAQEIATVQGARPLLWRTCVTLGNLYRVQSRREEAESAFSTAGMIIEELAASIPDGYLQEDFLRQATAVLPRTHSLFAPPLTPRRAAKQTFGGLTQREREVAVLIARGKANRVIADELVVSYRTVETHVGAILSKLGFNSRAQIAVWAVEVGLVKHSELQ